MRVASRRPLRNTSGANIVEPAAADRLTIPDTANATPIVDWKNQHDYLQYEDRLCSQQCQKITVLQSLRSIVYVYARAMFNVFITVGGVFAFACGIVLIPFIISCVVSIVWMIIWAVCGY